MVFGMGFATNSMNIPALTGRVRVCYYSKHLLLVFSFTRSSNSKSNGMQRVSFSHQNKVWWKETLKFCHCLGSFIKNTPSGHVCFVSMCFITESHNTHLKNMVAFPADSNAFLLDDIPFVCLKIIFSLLEILVKFCNMYRVSTVFTNLICVCLCFLGLSDFK